MTGEEIVRHWRQAKRQDAHEIKVLAELNSVGQEEIRRVLESAGEAAPGRAKKPNYGERYRALYGQGLTDTEIAGRLGCSKSAVCTWRKREGLPKNEPRQSAPAIYSQVEALLAALPEGASRAVRQRAGDLLSGMFGEYLEERLALKGGGEMKPPPAE